MKYCGECGTILDAGKRYHRKEPEPLEITIKDIAADAKVSVSTVSRVMNGSKAVSDELRHRVMRSIEKYHYIPNAEARSLVTKNTHLVAVLEADLRNPITAIHLKQISDVCMKHNKVVIACDYDFDNKKALVLMDRMLERNIDGLIFQGVHLTDEILKKLSLKSSEGGFKITIVWLPEKMHPVCANKLLKLLEEPPEKTIFLLVSEAPDMILPTILSRTQRMNVRKIDEASIDRVLQSKYHVQPADSISIAHLANGNFVKALETIHLNEENQLFFELFVNLMRLSYQRKIKEMKMWSEQVASMGRERQKNFLEYCQRMIRENFVFNLHQRNLTYMTINEQNFATRFAPFVNERNVMGIMDELSEAQLHIEQNVNAKMVFFDFSLKMIVLLKQ